MKTKVLTRSKGLQPTAQVAQKAQWLSISNAIMASVRGSEVAHYGHAPFGVAGVPFYCSDNGSATKNALNVAAPR